MLRVIASLLACLSATRARDVGKALRTMPIVTNSLVNLGKMDIVFHFNTRPQDLSMQSDFTNQISSPFFSSKAESFITEPCPCSSLKYIRDSTQNHPSEILSKILSGNDLFSFKEPTSSTLCCDSHENVKEDILFEFGPKQSQILANQPNSFSFLPYLLDSIQNKPNSYAKPAKTKAVEIFIFPKKRGLPADVEKLTTNKKNFAKNENIKIVGDKEIKNDFKTYQFLPPFMPSVKKDVTLPKIPEYEPKENETNFTVNNNSNTV